MRPVILDLYCGAGGAAMGYHRAGFEVIGVDISPQPRYPFTFWEYDALRILRILSDGYMVEGHALADFDAIHASPPCQGYSYTRTINPHAHKYPKSIKPVREAFRATGIPYVIENVEGAKSQMIDPVVLCGSQFIPHSKFREEKTYLRRHRLFEVNWPLPEPGAHDHSGYAFPVFGHGPGGSQNPHLRGKGAAAKARQLMDINWMTRKELDESIPPYYTEYIGGHLMSHLGWLKGMRQAA
jgi:DNA (cytosine-5)-methyltransferase 1